MPDSGNDLAPKPKRPPNVDISSIGRIYREFEELFLAEKQSLILSPCGHKIYCFEHHFFHMAGVLVEGVEQLSMPKERATLTSTFDGLAHYELRDKGSRAKHLGSARQTLERPDEVWADNPYVQSAKWVYLKEYDSQPYGFSVALVGEWQSNSIIIVPFSSFPVERRNVKRWRNGRQIFP
jgi:hypothetical protein